MADTDVAVVGGPAGSAAAIFSDRDAGRGGDLRERDLDRRADSYLTAAEVERRRERGHRRLLEHVDDDLVLERARAIESRRESSEVS